MRVHYFISAILLAAATDSCSQGIAHKLDLRGSTTDVERDSTWFGMRNQLFTRRWWRDQAREKLTYSRNRHWWKSEDDPGNTGEILVKPMMTRHITKWRYGGESRLTPWLAEFSDRPRWGDVHADQRYARRSWEKFVRPSYDNIWQ